MREYSLGLLGTALVYAVVWFQLTPEGAGRATTHSKAPATGHDALASGSKTSLERRPRPTDEVRARSAAEDRALQESTQPRVGPSRGARAGVLDPLPKALPRTIERMAELQRLAADPSRLAERVQRMESDEAELAELKAFAEQFVTLPPDRGGRHIPSSRGHIAAPSGRR